MAEIPIIPRPPCSPIPPFSLRMITPSPPPAAPPTGTPPPWAPPPMLRSLVAGQWNTETPAGEILVDRSPGKCDPPPGSSKRGGSAKPPTCIFVQLRGSGTGPLLPPPHHHRPPEAPLAIEGRRVRWVGRGGLRGLTSEHLPALLGIFQKKHNAERILPSPSPSSRHGGD